MPILPLNHKEPFFATLGVMLYPATNGTDPLNASAYAAQGLAAAVKNFRESGGTLTYDLTDVLLDAGQPLTDLKERWWGGRVTGEAFKIFYALYITKPALASWSNAIKLVELTAKRYDQKGARTDLWQAKRTFISVAHLWAARSIREAKSFQDPEAGYDASTDFRSFLAEAEILRRWGQAWRPLREKSEPPLPPNVWQVPDGWEPPARQPGWPNTGMIPHITLPEELLGKLRPAGRPSKRS
jgi:hypothetical protein